MYSNVFHLYSYTLSFYELKSLNNNEAEQSAKLISIQMPVYMSSLMNAGKHIYTITLCVCVCVCVCAYPRVQFPCRRILKPYLLSKRRYCQVGYCVYMFTSIH